MSSGERGRSKLDALTKIRNTYFNRQRAVAWEKKGKRVLGYMEIYVPEEVMVGADILPIRVLGHNTYPKFADLYLPTYFCPHQRSCLDNILKGLYDYVDGFVTSDTCDENQRMFDVIKSVVKKPYLYMLGLPHRKTERAINYFVAEVAKFKQSLEDFYGLEITDQNLKRAIDLYNENRALLKRVYDLRRGDPPLLRGSEALMTVISSMLTSKEENSELLRQLLEEIPKRSDGPEKRPRLLVTGSLIYDVEMLSLMEDAGANVVADDISIGSRYFYDEVDTTISDPIRAIAKRYVERIPSAHMHFSEERFDHLENMIDRYKVDGVVVHVLKFCHPYLGDYPLIKAKLESLEMPFVRIEDEQSLGERQYSRHRTIIETFVDVLAQKGGV